MRGGIRSRRRVKPETTYLYRCFGALYQGQVGKSDDVGAGRAMRRFWAQIILQYCVDVWTGRTPPFVTVGCSGAP